MRPDVQELLDYWQAELDLRDWRITWEWVPDLKVNGRSCYAVCDPLPDNRTARVQLCSTKSYDVEEKLVHELLHCPMSAFGTREPAAVAAEEQFVWPVARALVRAKGTERHGVLVRAARAAIIERVFAPTPRIAAGARRKTMDPIMLAAFEAALEAADPVAAVKALIEKIKAVGGAEPVTEEPAMGAAIAPQSGEPPLMARAAKSSITATGKPMTLADVQNAVRLAVSEENAKQALFFAARASRVGFTDAHAAFGETLNLRSARAFVDGFAAATTEDPIKRAAIHATVESTTELPEVTPAEAEAIRVIRSQFGHRDVAQKPEPGVWDMTRLKSAKAPRTETSVKGQG